MQRPQRHVPRGFALLSAIFLLLVLSVLGAYMVSLATVQHTTAAQDIQGTRAFDAAHAGLEWGVYQVMTPEQSNLPAGLPQYVCPSSPTVISALGGALTGYSVTVQCAASNYNEAGNQINIYQITATSSFGAVGSTGYVQRQISASLNTCRLNGAPCVN